MQLFLLPARFFPPFNQRHCGLNASPASTQISQQGTIRSNQLHSRPWPCCTSGFNSDRVDPPQSCWRVYIYNMLISCANKNIQHRYAKGKSGPDASQRDSRKKRFLQPQSINWQIIRGASAPSRMKQINTSIAVAGAFASLLLDWQIINPACAVSISPWFISLAHLYYSTGTLQTGTSAVSQSLFVFSDSWSISFVYFIFICCTIQVIMRRNKRWSLVCW